MIRPDAELLLDIQDLHASVEDKPILKGVNLQVRAGEVHAVMGRNGSGKSTLSKVLAGHPAYRVTGGSVRYRGQDLFELEPEERARLGVFLGFQYPVEIPGVSNLEFLRVSTNARREKQGKRSSTPLPSRITCTTSSRWCRWTLPSLSACLLYTSPSPRDLSTSRMPSSA